MSKPKWEQVGSIRKGEDGSLYMKVEKDIPAGRSVQLKKPVDEIQRKVQMGWITQDEANERIAKVPEYIKFDLYLKPPKTDDKF
jgi:hypothetical protein